MKISFIGFGSMAKAIANGLVTNPIYQLAAAAPSLPVGVNKNGIQTHHQNSAVLQDADIVILAVKPKQMDTVLQEIMPNLHPSCLLISVAAGLSLEWFSKRLDKRYALIRTMPNTPVSVGLGATAMVANEHTTTEQLEQASSIFSTVGLTYLVTKEEDMDTFTALSGSGPAYAFLFVEALTNAATSLGLDSSVAQQFALQTCKGALKLTESSNLSLSQLRNQVTSPGGTTAAALEILEKELEKLIALAMQAAKNRAHELGQNY